MNCLPETLKGATEQESVDVANLNQAKTEFEHNLRTRSWLNQNTYPNNYCYGL